MLCRRSPPSLSAARRRVTGCSWRRWTTRVADDAHATPACRRSPPLNPGDAHAVPRLFFRVFVASGVLFLIEWWLIRARPRPVLVCTFPPVRVGLRLRADRLRAVRSAHGEAKPGPDCRRRHGGGIVERDSRRARGCAWRRGGDASVPRGVSSGERLADTPARHRFRLRNGCEGDVFVTARAGGTLRPARARRRAVSAQSRGAGSAGNHERRPRRLSFQSGSSQDIRTRRQPASLFCDVLRRHEPHHLRRSNLVHPTRARAFWSRADREHTLVCAARRQHRRSCSPGFEHGLRGGAPGGVPRVLFRARRELFTRRSAADKRAAKAVSTSVSIGSAMRPVALCGVWR